MANRQGDVDLREAQVSAPQLELWLGLAWLGLAWLGLAWLGDFKGRNLTTVRCKLTDGQTFPYRTSSVGDLYRTYDK
jgi:hypothetical protein